LISVELQPYSPCTEQFPLKKPPAAVLRSPQNRLQHRKVSNFLIEKAISYPVLEPHVHGVVVPFEAWDMANAKPIVRAKTKERRDILSIVMPGDPDVILIL
jgi:hypothetical protein